jgi:hypothetical protein
MRSVGAMTVWTVAVGTVTVVAWSVVPPSESSAASATSESTSSEVVEHSLEILRNIFALLSRLLGWFLFRLLLRLLCLIFVDTCDDGCWSIFWSNNLDEWVLMTESLFADITVVKVLADAALVSNSNDRMYTTTITSDVSMNV